MTIEELNQKKDKIDVEIEKLTKKRDEIVNQIEEENEEEELKEVTKKNENPNSFIHTFISLMSFIGIIAGIIYVIYTKKGGIE